MNLYNFIPFMICLSNVLHIQEKMDCICNNKKMGRK